MYRRLEIWKNSISLIKEVYAIVDALPQKEEYNLKSQLRRAVISVSLNIAEGKCKSSAKDFSHFLNISSASLSEVEAIIYICKELNYIDNIDDIIEQIHILNKKINSLRKKLQEKINE